MTSRSIILVTGPARSGKSEWAETLAQSMAKPVVYVATAFKDKEDKEWLDRIQLHQQRRPSSWQTLEISTQLSEFLLSVAPPQCLLIDSLGTWVANFLDQDTDTWNQTLEGLISSLQHTAVDVILVAEETGWGVVPAYPVGRLFRDRLGKLVRHVGAISSPVYLVTGGHVLNLSVLGQPLDRAMLMN